MIPRGVPDIGWKDLFYGVVAPVLPGVDVSVDDESHLACLSVRSAFDLVLQELALPRGSEIMVSAITIPDMVKIIEHHGLVPVPLDIDPDTLSLSAGSLTKALSPRSRAVVIAHLFGSRAWLGPVMRFASEHGLFVVEDCAQAFDGGPYKGHQDADCSLFSFGPIKTATSLGGAIVRFKDPDLLARVAARQVQYPVQPATKTARRSLLFLMLKGLARPKAYGAFAGVCRVFKKDHDELIVKSLRGFPGPDLIAKLRHRPSKASVRLLARRLRSSHQSRIAKRVIQAEKVTSRLGRRWPGSDADHHTHWVVPVISRDPPGLVERLRSRGFDATTRGSSLFALPAPKDRPDLDPAKARALVDSLVYLPSGVWMRDADIETLCALIEEFEARS